MVANPKLSGNDSPVEPEPGTTANDRIEQLQELVASWRKQARECARQACEDRDRGVRDLEIRHDERMIALDKCADEVANALAEGSIFMAYRIARGPFDRWYIFHPTDARLAWSRWLWVPFVRNFESEQDAVEHAGNVLLWGPSGEPRDE
jgi:hypothetical protein